LTKKGKKGPIIRIIL